jgi:hypothetical protein
MPERCNPLPHSLLAQRNSGITAADAASEWIDNSLRAGATKITLAFGGYYVSCEDNGTGTDNLDAILQSGNSTAHDDGTTISQYGVGGKDAQLYFGNKVTVISCYKGMLYETTWDYEDILQTGEYPLHYDHRLGKLAPPSTVGTLIRVTKLNSRRRPNFTDLCRKLALRYRLALLNGIKIIIADDIKGQVTTLDAAAAKSILNLGADVKTIQGKAAGKTFILTYGELNEPDQLITGIHFGFGHRFVMRITMLGGESLPIRLYAEVKLSAEWKTLLMRNKTKIEEQDFEELCAAIRAILGDYLRAAQQQKQEQRIEKLNFVIRKMLEDILIIDPTVEGDYEKGATVVTTEGGRGPGPVEPKPHESNIVAINKGSGNNGAKKKRQRPPGIHIKLDHDLGEHLSFHIGIDRDQKLVLTLNPKIPVIKEAYYGTSHIDALIVVIASALSQWLQKNPDIAEQRFNEFIEHIKKLGYKISFEEPEHMQEPIFSYIISHCMMDHSTNTTARTA